METDLERYAQAQLINALYKWKRDGAHPGRLAEFDLIVNYVLGEGESICARLMHIGGGILTSGYGKDKKTAVNAVLGVDALFDCGAKSDAKAQEAPLTNGFDSTEEEVAPAPESDKDALLPLSRDRQKELRGGIAALNTAAKASLVAEFKKAFNLPQKITRIGDRITQQRHSEWLEAYMKTLPYPEVTQESA